MQDTLASVADITEVRASFRLGWAVAEVRGRARLGPEDPGAPQRPDLDRRGHALPLALERSSIEQAIEAREVLASLARQLKVDVLLRLLPLPRARGLSCPYGAEVGSDLRFHGSSVPVDCRRFPSFLDRLRTD